MKKILIILSVIVLILVFTLGVISIEYHKYKPRTPNYSCNLKRAYKVIGKTYSEGKEEVIYALLTRSDMGVIHLEYPKYDFLQEGEYYIFDFLVDSHIKDIDPAHKIQSILDNYKELTISEYSEGIIDPMKINYCK